MPASNESIQSYPIGEYYSYYPTWVNNGTVPTPNQQQFYGQDDIVISGVSGRFPDAENIEEYSKFLYGQQQQGEEKSRQPFKPDFSQFDYSFFGLTEKQAQLMEPQLKVLLETTYESIFDSGFNPTELKGSKTGVFIGTTTEYDGIYGGKTKYADEIARYFEFSGPFYTIDTTQSSGLMALDKAINAIRIGSCDYAIVGGVSFDKQYGQFEYGTVGTVFIQKSSFSRRFYAKILNSKSMTGEKDVSFASTNGESFMKLLRQVLTEFNIDPSLVTYFEQHATDKKIFDSNEYKWVAEAFGKNRNLPLFVGSTKSTGGYEHGIISLVKMLIAAQKGSIPSALKFQQPTTGEYYGRFMDENTKFFGGLMALNSFGYRGTSVHIVLQPNNEQLMSKYGSSLFWNQDISQYLKKERLFTFSARTEEALINLFDQIQMNPTDLSTHYLLNQNSLTSPVTHPFRGYTILNSNKKIREFKKVSGEKRPLWWFFNGLGTQWAGMGKELMQIEYFAATMYKIADLLRPFGFDLKQQFLMPNARVCESPFYSLVFIAAIQITFVDLMRFLGVQPDGIVGYSFGEFVAAYADNALSWDETIMSVYHLGKLIEEAKLPESAMATIGLSYEEAIKQCPQSIVPSFYETKDTVIVSGPKKAIQQYVEQLKLRGIYAKETESYGLGLHSYLMAPIAAQFKVKLESILRTPKLRSSKWYSTSSLQQTEPFKYASPEYFVNNLINPVYFYQVINHMPTNAITIEFGPHAYLQPILTRTLGDKFTYISFMKRDAVNHLEQFWSAFGRLYAEGWNIDTLKMFLPFRKDLHFYPVPSTTKFLSAYVSWYRPNGKYFSPKYEQFEIQTINTYPYEQYKPAFAPAPFNGNQYTYTFDISKGSEYQYLTGHQVNGKVTYPTSGYLYMVWNAFAKMRNVPFYELPVAFENIEFSYPTVFDGPSVEMTVKFYEQFGRFEVYYNSKVVVTGRVYLPQETSVIGWQEYNQTAWLAKSRTDLLEQDEIYREFKVRGYDYADIFQGIYKSNIDGTRGELFWNGKWISYLESMIQMFVFGKSGLQYPTRISSIRIDPRVHGKYITKLDENKNFWYNKPTGQQFYGHFEYPEFTGMMPFAYDQYTKTYIAGGVEMSGLYSTVWPITSYIEQPVSMERVKFVPYFEHFGQDAHFDQEEKHDFEYIDSYINEIRYYVGEILHKIELATKPSISHSSSFESFSSYPSSSGFKSFIPTPTQYNGKFVEGKFLELLKEALKLEVDSQYIYKVKQLLGDNLAFYKSWRDDSVFYYNGGRYTYLKSILDTVFENVAFGHTEQPKLKVLEIAPQFYSFGPKINELFAMYPSLTVDYHYAPIGDFHPELYQEWIKQSPFPITKVDWNLKTQEMPAPQYKDYDLVIFNGSLSYLPFFEDKMMVKKWLQVVSEKLVKPQGFFMVHEFVNHFDTLNQLYSLEQFVFNGQFAQQKSFKYQLEGEWRKLFDDYFFPAALKQDNVFSIFYLYRKYFSSANMITARLPKDYEIYINDVASFDWIEKVKVALADSTYERVWLICENGPTSGLIGLVNCLRFEAKGERIRCVFIAEPTTVVSWKGQFEFIKRGDLVMNVFKYGKWGSYRHVFDFQELEAPIATNVKYAYVDWLKRGDLSTLEWIQSAEPFVKDASQMLINVMYGGLNYRDYLVAKGTFNPEYLPEYKKTSEYYFGMEFSGYGKDKRYMGIVPSRGLSTVLVANNKYLWEIPQSWSFEQAATVPISYAQAYYSLVVRGGLKHGESVFIHSGATPFGQAAISVAFGYNCKVFTTVGTKEEREYLMARYPGKLVEESFVNIFDDCFDRHILRYTQGKGVNVVVNWYNGEVVQQSLRCLAPFGRFLEMSDYSKVQNYEFFRFNKNISFHSIFFDGLFDAENVEWSNVYRLVEEGIHLGVVRPFTPIIYEASKIQDAFKYYVDMKQPKFSKVLIKIGEPKAALNFFPKVWYSPFWTYIVTSGLSTFGLELAHWMIKRGARKIVLTSRTGVRTGYQQRKLEFLQKTYGAIISVSHYDAKDEGECILLIKEAIELSEEKKIGGIYHLETLFINGNFDLLKPEQFKRVWDAKYLGAYNLDKYSRKMDCQFVVFSSFASGYGYPGASAYGYVNSAVERLCELRRQDGKYAVAIQFGSIGEIDSVFETPEIVYNGTVPQKIYSALKSFEYILLRSKYTTVWSCYVRAEKFSPKYEAVEYFYPTKFVEKYEFPAYAPTPAASFEKYEFPAYAPTPAASFEKYEFPAYTPTPAPSFEKYEFPAYTPTPAPSFEKYEFPAYTPAVVPTFEKYEYPSETYPEFPAVYSGPAQYYNNTPTAKPKLYELIYKILGLKDTVRFDIPLVEFGLNTVLAGDLKSILEKYYQLIFTINEIQQFTFDKIKSIEQTFPYMKEYKTNYPTKFNYLMPKRLFEKLNEVEVTAKMYPLIVVHPIEGHVNMLKSWAKYMKYPVFGIQYTSDALKYDSIEKLADFYLQQIDAQFGSETRFHLVGYSFGGSVAFEMALRKSGRIASLAFLDGSYMYVNPLINTFKSKYLSKDLATIEAEFLFGFVSQYTQIASRVQFVHDLVQLSTFDFRVQYAIKYLMKVTQFNFDLVDLEQAARSYVQRMFMSYKYQPKSVLKYNEILLVKPTQKTDYSELFGEDYGLGVWIQGKICMQMVDGDQRTFLESTNGYKIATILNEYLTRYYF